jgi:hypothetical protein
LKEIVDAVVTGGLITSDGRAHLQMEVVQTFGSERGVCIEVWPA